MSLEIRVQAVAELAHGEAKKFSFHREGVEYEEEGFVLRLNDSFHAYLNNCEHWGVDLDMGDGKFWSERAGRIVCQTHAATYRPEDGVCDAGPCVGARLEKFSMRLDGADAIVSVPSQTEALEHRLQILAE